MKLLLYLAIGFILWRIVRTYVARSSASRHEVGGAPRRGEQVETRREPPIDYSRVRDAEYREIRDERDRHEGRGRREARDGE